MEEEIVESSGNKKINVLKKAINALSSKKRKALHKVLKKFYLNNIYFDGPIVSVISVGALNSILVTQGTAWFLDHVYHNQFKAKKLQLTDQVITTADFDGSTLLIGVTDLENKKHSVVSVDYLTMGAIEMSSVRTQKKQTTVERWTKS